MSIDTLTEKAERYDLSCTIFKFYLIVISLVNLPQSSLLTEMKKVESCVERVETEELQSIFQTQGKGG